MKEMKRGYGCSRKEDARMNERENEGWRKKRKKGREKGFLGR